MREKKDQTTQKNSRPPYVRIVVTCKRKESREEKSSVGIKIRGLTGDRR